jgi:CHAT domain-containing protein
MDRRLFPKDLFPSGHPNLIRDLNNLATALREVGDNLEADKTYRAALSARRSLIRSFATEKPEGEALTFLASAPATRDGFLTNASILRSEPADIYAEIWLEKGQLARVYEQRHQVARAAAGDPKTASLLAQLFQARRGRAELLAAPIAQDPATRKKREEDLGKYEKQIADLNGELRPLLTELEGTEMLGSATPKDLQKAIPVDAVVVDYLSYWHFDQTERTTDVPAHDKLTKSYLAFVITRASIAWLDLGPAKPIEAAIVAWREAIINGDAIPPELPAKVRELVWTKVRNEIPSGTNVVYVAPDLSLCRLPWSALPGDNPGTILVEDFAIATIPYTGFLLDQLSRHELRKKSPTLTLVVGGVKYDAELKTPDPKSVAEPPVKPGAKLGPWRELAEATAEADGMVKAARNKKLEVQKLDGEKATVAALLAELPKARITHIVTHGFFADPLFRSDFHLDEREFKMAARGERIGRAALSPLVMTGLVLAGANRPETPGRGIVTGESLIDLDLSGLELAVLSACETGLGDVAGGEGVFGLQRAFHMAGTRDVIASLWKVNDAATAALMGEFYRALWDDKLEPVFALQKAQLAVYRADPKNFREMARRGLGWGDKPFDPDKLHINDDGKNSPALWAAFTLSGPGRSDPSATESRASAEAPETDSIESQSSGAIETSHTPERNKSWSPWILPTAIAVASVFIILTTLIAAAVCGRLLARRATKS